MSIEARREYLTAIWERYRKARRPEKTTILNEYVQVTGLNRKYAIWRLSQPLERFEGRLRSGAPRRYSREELMPFVRDLWMSMEQIGAKRMKAALAIWLPFYRALDFTEGHRQALLRISPSTLERILHEVRQSIRPQGISSTRRSAYVLKNRIPIQTKDFNIEGPGHLEGDTVAHCGDRLEGEFVRTLTYTDIHTSWTETRAMPSGAALWVLERTREIEENLPFLIKSADYDNGSEFINYDVEAYWQSRPAPVQYVRSRPYKKNDQCYVEQKNFTHVRQLFGYERITGREMCERMNQIYRETWCPLHNFFLPSQKLLRKTRIGARIVKQYDSPKTPYQRLLESADLSLGMKSALELRYQSLNPFDLRLRLEMELKDFFSLLREKATVEQAA